VRGARRGDGHSPRWPGIDEAAKMVPCGRDGGEGPAMADGKSV
jgi:hypothetical protein